MKWITNCSKTCAEEKIADLTAGWPNRHIVVGLPQPTAWLTEEDLLIWCEYVGLYDSNDYR